MRSARDAAGPRGADVILLQHLQHGRADLAGDDAEMDEAQGQRRQDEMEQRADEGPAVARDQRVDGVEAGDGMGRGDVAGDPSRARQDAEPAIEDIDQQQPQPEGRGRDSGDRDGAAHLVDGLVLGHGREHAQRNAEDDGQQQGGDGELDGRREEQQDIVDHRPLGADRDAEIPMQQPADIGDVLHGDRLVEAELGPDMGDGRIGGALARHHPRRVARDHMGDDEGDDRDAEDDEDEENQPAADRIGKGHAGRS